MARRQRIALERQARMDLILDSAERLFAEKGYHETSINDIAEGADFSRTSVYQYFRSKEEIYVHLLDRYTDLLGERVATATAAAQTTPDKIRAYLAALRQLMIEKPSFFELYFIQRRELEPRLSTELQSVLSTKQRVFENVFRDFYRVGIEKGEVRDIGVKDASNLFFAQISGMLLLHQYFEGEFDVTLDDHLDRSLELYLEYVEKVD